MAKRDGLVVVARGDGWALAWPRAEWEALDEEEQRQVVARQAALLSQNVPQNKPRPARTGRGKGRSISAPRGVNTAAVAARTRPQV